MPVQFTADLNPKSNSISLSDMMKIGLYQAETEIANRRAQVAEQQQKEMPLIQNFMADPENKLPDGSFDIKKASQVLPAIAPLTGIEYATKLTNLTKNHIETSKEINNLSQQERGIIGSIYGAHAAAGTQDPNLVINSLNKLRQENPNLDRVVGLKVDALKQIPGGPAFNKALYQARNETLTPVQAIDQFAPKATTSDIAGKKVTTVTQPSILGETPTVTAMPLGGAGNVQPAEPKVDTKQPKIIKEDTSLNYVPNQSGIRNLDKYQEAALVNGESKVSTANMNLAAQKDLQQSVRKVEEFMGSASGSKEFQMVRQGAKFVFGNSDLDSLVKNIAQVQARNAAVMGLDKTDASRDLNAKLSGSENIDEKTLRGIMQQVKAESVAAEMFTQGLNKFVEKRGDINGKIQAQKFQNTWAEHYDPRIFQVDNIASSNIPEAEKGTRIKDITSRMTDAEFKKYKEDRTVIHRLSKGLYQ
jgi:hypothetical protein